MADDPGRSSAAYDRIEDPATLRRLFEASLLLESSLHLGGLLSHIVEEALSLSNARYGALGVLDASGEELAEFFVSGLAPDVEAELLAGPLPKGHGLLGLLVRDPRPLRVRVIGAHPESVGFPPNHPPMASFLGAPIKVRHQVYGNLYLTEKIGADEFTADDQTVIEALALFAGIAIENAQLHQRAGQIAVFEERDRMARDLHDGVIQRLFAIGLSLQGIATAQTGRAVAKRMATVVEDIDETIRQVRATIFELGGHGRGHGITFRVQGVAEELRPVLGFAVQSEFVGPVDTGVSDDVADQVLITLREALTNVGRHAQATSARIRLALIGRECRLEVRDDGCGFVDGPGIPGTGMGLVNMRKRAEALGGTFELLHPESGGTTVVWQVPAFDGTLPGGDRG